jgi:rhamnose transport system permease protein
VLTTLRRGAWYWELGLIAATLFVVFAGNAWTGGLLLSSYNLETTAANQTVLACLALGVAPVIINGDIDISIAGALSLCGVIMGRLWVAGLNIWVAAAVAVAIGAVLGLINGLVIVLLDLPSLAVTLGTMGAFLGAALLVLPNAVPALGGEFPSSLITLGISNVTGTPVPIALVVVIGLVLVLTFIVHATSFGKSLFAIGGNRKAALFSGIAVRRTRITTFVMAGIFAGIAAVLYLATYDTAVATMGSDTGLLLPAITAVILGGVSAYGGTGTIPGVAIALVLITMMNQALSLHGTAGDWQAIADGILLIAAIGVSTIAQAIHGRRRAPAAALVTPVTGTVPLQSADPAGLESLRPAGDHPMWAQQEGG